MILNTTQHNNIHWLTLAEIVFIVLTVLGLLASIFSRKWLYTLVPASAVLVFNIVNRFRLEQRLKKIIAANIKQTSPNFPEENTKNIPKRIANNNNILGVKEAKIIASLEMEMAKLHQSLKDVVTYLNKETLPERVTEIEKELNFIGAEIAEINSRFKQTPSIKAINSEPDPNPPSPTVAIKPQKWTYLQTLVGHEKAVTALEISLDGQYLVSDSWDQTLKLWNLPQGKL